MNVPASSEPARPPVVALLFDFDGTLWDCEPLVFQAYDEYFQRYGQRISPVLWSRVLGRTDVAPWQCLEELTGHPVDHAEAEAAVLSRKLALLAGGRRRAGVRRFLAEADGLGLRRGIVSNSHRGWVAKYAAQCGLDQGWELVECADGDQGRAKPGPALYLSALARMGLDADRVVAFEDSPTGVRAAKLAGIRCVAVRGPLTADTDFGEADACVPHFRQGAAALLASVGCPVPVAGRR